MKILIISTNADEAGAPRHVEAIVNGLESDFQFIVVFGEYGPVCGRLKRRGHIVHVVKEMRTSINPIKDLIALIKLVKIVHNYQPDIVHCHSAKAGMLGRLSAFFNGKSWLYTVHGWGWRGVSSFTKKLVFLIESILCKLPRGFFIFVAQDVMKDAVEILKLKSSNGVVIYNGVSPVDIRSKASGNPLIILMPARVSSAKDHHSLISAFELLNDDTYKLIVCGAGTEIPEFTDYSKQLAPNAHKNISFLGQRSDIKDIYSQCDIVALISNFEALPLSIIEAMSCSKAIIATEVGGIPELIKNEVNGLLVRPKAIEDIVDALKKCKDKAFRDRIGAQANLTYLENFTENSMLNSISRTYLSLRVESK